MRLTKAIDAIAQGSNFNHEVLVLLCEIADMLEDMTNPPFFSRQCTNAIGIPVEDKIVPENVTPIVAKKKGRPFKVK